MLAAEEWRPCVSDPGSSGCAAGAPRVDERRSSRRRPHLNPILASLISKGNKFLGDPYQGCFGNGEQNGYYTAPGAWANAHKVELAKFLAALKEAVAFIATHKSVAKATYAKLSGLPANVAAQAVIYPPEMNYKISAADFANWERIMKSYGQLPANAPDPSKLVLPLPSAS